MAPRTSGVLPTEAKDPSLVKRQCLFSMAELRRKAPEWAMHDDNGRWHTGVIFEGELQVHIDYASVFELLSNDEDRANLLTITDALDAFRRTMEKKNAASQPAASTMASRRPAGRPLPSSRPPVTAAKKATDVGEAGRLFSVGFWPKDVQNQQTCGIPLTDRSRDRTQSAAGGIRVNANSRRSVASVGVNRGGVRTPPMLKTESTSRTPQESLYDCDTSTSAVTRAFTGKLNSYHRPDAYFEDHGCYHVYAVKDQYWSAHLAATEVEKFHIIQLLEHNLKKTIVFFARWGRCGSSGNWNFVMNSSVEEGKSMFVKKFTALTRNEWRPSNAATFAGFRPVPSKYVLFEFPHWLEVTSKGVASPTASDRPRVSSYLFGKRNSLQTPPSSGTTTDACEALAEGSVDPYFPDRDLWHVYTQKNSPWSAFLLDAAHGTRFFILQLLQANNLMKCATYFRCGTVGQPGRWLHSIYNDVLTARAAFESKFRAKTMNSWRGAVSSTLTHFVPVAAKFVLVDFTTWASFEARPAESIEEKDHHPGHSESYLSLARAGSIRSPTHGMEMAGHSSGIDVAISPDGTAVNFGMHRQAAGKIPVPVNSLTEALPVDHYFDEGQYYSLWTPPNGSALSVSLICRREDWKKDRFFILQVLQLRQDVALPEGKSPFMFFRRGGRLSTVGSFSAKPYSTALEAYKEFAAKFAEKTNNKWLDYLYDTVNEFVPHPARFQLCGFEKSPATVASHASQSQMATASQNGGFSPNVESAEFGGGPACASKDLEMHCPRPAAQRQNATTASSQNAPLQTGAPKGGSLDNVPRSCAFLNEDTEEIDANATEGLSDSPLTVDKPTEPTVEVDCHFTNKEKYKVFSNPFAWHAVMAAHGGEERKEGKYIVLQLLELLESVSAEGSEKLSKYLVMKRIGTDDSLGTRQTKKFTDAKSACRLFSSWLKSSTGVKWLGSFDATVKSAEFSAPETFVLAPRTHWDKYLQRRSGRQVETDPHVPNPHLYQVYVQGAHIWHAVMIFADEDSKGFIVAQLLKLKPDNQTNENPETDGESVGPHHSLFYFVRSGARGTVGDVTFRGFAEKADATKAFRKFFLAQTGNQWKGSTELTLPKFEAHSGKATILAKARWAEIDVPGSPLNDQKKQPPRRLSWRETDRELISEQLTPAKELRRTNSGTQPNDKRRSCEGSPLQKHPSMPRRVTQTDQNDDKEASSVLNRFELSKNDKDGEPISYYVVELIAKGVEPVLVFYVRSSARRPNGQPKSRDVRCGSKDLATLMFEKKFFEKTGNTWRSDIEATRAVFEPQEDKFVLSPV